MLLFIIGLIEVASGELVYVAAIAVENVVDLRHALWIFSGSAGCRIFDTAHLAIVERLFVKESVRQPLFIDLIPVCCNLAAVLRCNYFNVRKTFA